MIPRKTIIATALGALCASAYAAGSPRDTVALPEITVVSPAKTNPALLPLDVSVVGAEEIDRSAETSLLPVLVAKVPGLFVSERGFAGYGISGGSAGAVNIRGVGQGNKVLFMIDGQPQWAGVFGHSLADSYVANGVERVEVVKGPSSLLYGSNAMGGSVNIITRRQREEGVSGRARAMFGSFSTQKFDLSAGVRKGKFGATVAGQLDRSNGYREGSAFWLANEFVQLQYAPSRHWETGANLDMTQTRADNPGTLQEPLENMWTKLFRGTASVYAKDDYGMASGGVQAFINWGRNKVDDGNAPGSAPRDYLFNSTDYNIGVTLYQTLRFWQANELSAGVDFQHWGGHNWNTGKDDASRRSSEFRRHVNEISGYAMMQQGFWRGLLSLNAGVRIQHGSSYGNVWVPQAGVIVRPGRGSEFKLSFSKGFRAPNLRELYLYPPHNPGLKPEYMYNYEASYRQHLLGGRLMVGAALFFIDGKDMIQTVRVDGRPRNMNVGRFINKGFELETAFRPAADWSVAANYSFLHTDAEILQAPKHKLNAEVNWTPGRLSFTLEDMSVWSMRTGAPGGHTESYTLLNLRAAYTLGDRVPVTLFVKGDNLTDKHYEVIYGCPMPGATVMGGVEIRF